MRNISAIVLISLSIGHVSSSADEFWRPGFIGNWNDIANWNNAVPATGADTQARARQGGTINVNSIVDTAGNVDIRLSDQAANPLVTMNWNPGSGSTPQFLERVILSDQPGALSIMNHQSGHIRVDADWFHIARRGTATYNASGTASLAIDDRLSVGENGVADANLSGNANLTVTSGNESFVARNSGALGTLTITDNAVAESRHWRIADQVGATGTVELSGSGTLRAGHNGDGQISVGRRGAGTVTMTDNSTVDLVNNTSFRIGHQNAAGVGYVEMNGNSRIVGTGNGNAHVVMAESGSNATLIMNNTSGITDMRRIWINNGGSGNSTVEMNGSSFINLNRENREIYIANGGTSNGSLIMRDDSTISTGNLLADWGGGTSGGVATIEQHNNAKITATGWVEFGGGNNDTSTWTINDDAQLIATGGGGQFRIGARDNGTGVMTLNGNAFVEANRDGNVTKVASENNARGILNLNDNAFFHARNEFQVAVNAGSQGTVNHNSGTLQIDNLMYLGGGSGGTYNLNGGTLRTDRIDIRASGTFNWGAGTLTMRENNRGTNGNGIEIEIVGANPNLTTGAGSILDLGDVYTSNGDNWDTLDLNGGTLDLSAAGDTLEIWRYVSSFRPGGSNTSQTYEIKLINSPNIVGEFDNVTGPGPDFQYFGVYNSAQVATLGLTPANVPRNRGFIDYRADGAYFVFNVAGQVPEPSTGLFLLFGTLMLRGVSVVRRNQRIRKSYSA